MFRCEAPMISRPEAYGCYVEDLEIIGNEADGRYEPDSVKWADQL